MKKWLFAACALFVLIAQPRLASAAVTASLTAVGPTTINGCPATLQFSGTINGTPGTVVTYSFSRVVSNVPQTVNGGTFTIPPFGMMPVHDTISIASSTTGTTYDQIWVHNISNGQSDVYSNEVNFSVACGSPPTTQPATPFPTPFATIPPRPKAPPIPGSLSSTNDSQVCTAHAGFAGGLACTAGFGNGMLALVWNAPNACATCIDGYNVYRSDGGQHTFIYKQNNGRDTTLALVTKPSDGFNGKCYVVTAYSGNVESAPSSPYCVSGPVDTAAVRNFNITSPSATRAVYHAYHFTGIGPGCGLPNSGEGPDPGLVVGFNHDYANSVGITCYEDTLVQQVAVSFELGSAGILLRNPKTSVKSAILAFNRYGGKGQCLGGVHLPTGDWSNATDLIPNKDYISNIAWNANGLTVFTPTVKISGSIYNIDVTSAINDFAKGVWPDHGFLLIGGNEDESGFHDNHSCLSQFGNFSLSLQVTINP
jgi:hypothetical protein